jgi:hypothetical protein
MSRHSPNPKPRPSTDTGAQELARKHSRAAIEKLAYLMENAGTARDQAFCAIALLDRGHGKPAQFSTGDAQRLRSALEMTDEELIGIAAGGPEQITDPE